ncbi:putative hydrolase of the HAD superfamily [Acinetobacter sp. DSM 11652]|nr:putative hydrolase of the HAD superfamily [Acinetobacter sp. DSM 11652]
MNNRDYEELIAWANEYTPLSTMKIQAVIFDLDNTLTHRDLSVQTFSRALFNTYKQQIDQSASSAQAEILETIRYIDHGGYPIRERMTAPTIGGSVAHALLNQLKWKKAPELDELSDYWFNQFGLNAVMMPNAIQTLDRLKNKGFKLAIISNGGHFTRHKIIEGLGIAHYFDVIMSSEKAGVSKPQAEIFHMTCQQLGIAPDHCLYVGDHPVNDYWGATQAGLDGLYLAGFHQSLAEHQPPLNKTIQTLPEILAYIKQVNA